MSTDRSNRLFELGPEAGQAPFEDAAIRYGADFQSRAPRAGADFKEIALSYAKSAGATVERLGFEIDDIPVDAEVRGSNGQTFLVLARGTPDEHPQSGVRKTDTLEKAGFRAIQLARNQTLPILLITSDLPDRSSKAGRYLAKLDNDLWDAVAVRGDFRGFRRIQSAFCNPVDDTRPAAPWRSPIPDGPPTLFDDASDLQNASPPSRQTANGKRPAPPVDPSFKVRR